jgi:hypothetical protein
VSKTHYLDEYNHVACNSRKIEATSDDVRFVTCDRCLNKVWGGRALVVFLREKTIPRGIYITAVLMVAAGAFDGWPARVAYLLGIVCLIISIWGQDR